MIPQYSIFYSWQSDNMEAKRALRKALDAVVKQLKGDGIALEIMEGGGGEGFISIEDAVRMKIRRCDIFMGDVTPVGNVALKGKLLPNANVMYEMGIATETMTADRILAVAMAGDWKVENMPFDFNHYSMLMFKDGNDIENLTNKIRDRIKETDRIARRINNRFFQMRLLSRNIESGKYLPDTFLEDRLSKQQARIFAAPYKMYRYLYERLTRMSFEIYNRKRKLNGKPGNFKLDIEKWDIRDKAIDLEMLHRYAKELKEYLSPRVEAMDKDGNHGWANSLKVRRIAEKVGWLNGKLMVVTSVAGQGKTNFVCDLVNNLFIADGIPFVFVNAYELSAEQLTISIAQEYNFIGNGSLEDVLLKAEHLCQQRLQHLIIVIDGLNENPQQRLFQNNLVKVLQALCCYEHVKVIMTCRTEFFNANFQMLRDTFKDELIEVELGKKHGREELYENEVDCLFERYSNHFKTKGEVHPVVRHGLKNNLLLLRIFFETYQGGDVSKLDYIDRIDLFERYYDQLCEKIQKVINHDTRLTDVRGIADSTFTHVVEWMIENNVFRNLPFEALKSDLPHNEQGSFTSFLNANLILKLDLLEDKGGTEEVVNYTFEEIRDFMIVRYLLTNIYPNDKAKFYKLVDTYTDENNNLAEGIRRFLFLFVRNREIKDIYEEIKKKDWFIDAFNYYIWEVSEEKLTDEDVKLVKQLIIDNPRDTVRYIAYRHWSPVRHPKINLNTLFETVDQLPPKEQIDLFEKVWTNKNGRRDFWGGPDITERSEMIRVVREGIKRRKDGDEQDKQILSKLDRYLVETSPHSFYVPALDNDDPKKAPIIIRGYDVYRYLMAVHKGEKKDFLKVAGVGKGYAKQMFCEIYDAIFAESEDVEQIYNDYYKREYPNLQTYISMHYSITSKEVNEYVNAINSGESRIIDFSSIDYGSSSFENLFSSDEMFIRMYNWLNWKRDEN